MQSFESGTDLHNCGTTDANVSCNRINATVRFYITNQECAIILRIEFCEKFKLVAIAPVCIQQSISVEANHVEAVYITDESEADYCKLQKNGRNIYLLEKKQETL